MYSQCQTAAPFSRTPLKSTDTDALWHLVWIMCAHTLLSNCVCVCGSVCCLFSVSEMSSHARLLDKACYGALRGTSRARGENIWKGTFLRGDQRAAHSQTGWRSLYPPSYFLFQSFLTPTRFFSLRKEVLPEVLPAYLFRFWVLLVEAEAILWSLSWSACRNMRPGVAEATRWKKCGCLRGLRFKSQSDQRPFCVELACLGRLENCL